jgi:glycosyltransferase XagB
VTLSVPVSDRRPYVRQTARRTATAAQRTVLVVVLTLVLGAVLVAPGLVAVLSVATAMLFLTVFMGLRLLLVWASRGYRAPQVAAVADEDLPRYTTLHPMYDEAHMLPSVVAAMEALDYPKDRLECLLVLEERDTATVEAARAYPLPDYLRVVVTPAVEPYGKPKACNYALQFATGEFVVIYDAEDRPEPDQLRLAVGTFRAAEDRGEPLGCLQARLVFDNEVPDIDGEGRVRRDEEGYDLRPTTWTSRLLGNEYAVHFDLVLTGLARLGLPVPLGGTSNHFPVHVLHEVAFDPDEMPSMPLPDASVGAWDPWNVTEDAELGGAIAAAGWRTAVMDSHTDEEACLTARAALNQRSRWVKGYAQTSLVLMRNPIRAAHSMGLLGYLAFLLQVGGTFVSLALSPIFWTIFVVYMLTGSPRIIALFPGPLYYAGMGLLIVGNLALLSISLFAAVRRERFGTVRYLLLCLPAWWMLLSAATYLAAVELLVPSWRPSWNKTAHGVRYASPTRRAAIATSVALAEWRRDRPAGSPVRVVSRPAVHFLAADRCGTAVIRPATPAVTRVLDPSRAAPVQSRPARAVPSRPVPAVASGPAALRPAAAGVPVPRGAVTAAAAVGESPRGPVAPRARRRGRPVRDVPKPPVRWLPESPQPRSPSAVPVPAPVGAPGAERRPGLRVPVREMPGRQAPVPGGSVPSRARGAVAVPVGS